MFNNVQLRRKCGIRPWAETIQAFKLEAKPRNAEDSGKGSEGAKNLPLSLKHYKKPPSAKDCHSLSETLQGKVSTSVINTVYRRNKF